MLALVMGMLNFTGVVLFPTLLHDLRGYPDNAIGWLIAARGVGNWAAFAVVAQFTRIAPRLAIGCGMAIQAAAGLWMGQFDINMTDFHVFWSNMLQGFGQSIAFTPMTVMAFSTLPREQVTEGSSIFTLMRNFGSSLYISVAILVVTRSTAANYARMTEYVTPFGTNVPAELAPHWSLATTSGLMNLAQEIQRQAAMIGYLNAFHLTALVAAMAIPMAWFMRPVERERA
jgi:DHA2 family multidrug resistance protein